LVPPDRCVDFLGRHRVGAARDHDDVGRHSACHGLIANSAGVILLSEFLEREKSRQHIMRALEHEASFGPLTKLQTAVLSITQHCAP
jgi:hypothetical protein